MLLVPSFLLLPPHTWATHSWSRYAISASTSPLLNALMLGLLDQAFKVGSRKPVLCCLAGGLLHQSCLYQNAWRNCCIVGGYVGCRSA